MGTPNEIAEKMQKWFNEEAADGFNVICPRFPDQLHLLGTTVTPIFEARNLRTPPIKG